MIGWSGTSAGWLGFEKDEELCAKIEEETGVKATTSVLALNKAMKFWKYDRLGLVTPYMDDVQAKIMENYKEIGVEVMGEKHLRVEKNRDIADIGEGVLDRMVWEVVSEGGCQVVSTFCTNLVAAQRVAYWEQRFCTPVFDTVTTVIWDMLKQCEVDTSGVMDWGMIFFPPAYLSQ